MLELKNIVKEYPAGEGTVAALRGVELCFRDCEFVSILGPSGCGKTTTLNIIGGLDRYTEGDLRIHGVSTKQYKDRDWDSYRNHSVGFVFQSYNLIPHQSVLQNVELALSLSGVSKQERRRRAKEALERVGLGDQLKKKPSEMSGGQMQRVAIARAIVNDPAIVLADEPTGALDTETGIQVMEILKEISRDRLVVMVTHNPELAEAYSTRIVKMLDGKITEDSNPITPEELAAASPMQADAAEAHSRKRRERKPSMSFATSFGLSLKNLFTKKGRTALTSFAGSIGIIGIALILAVSQGMTNYINVVQEETLSSYPLTLEATHMDVSTLMQSFLGQAESNAAHENDAVYQKALIYNLINALNNVEETENDLASFKTYMEAARADEASPLHHAVNGVRYAYDLELLVYTKSADGKIIRSDTGLLMQELLQKKLGVNMAASGTSGSMMSGMSAMPMASSSLWTEMLAGDNGALVHPLLEKQYDVVYGTWPNSYNEIVLVLDENNELDDMTLYALGLASEADVERIIDAALQKTPLEPSGKSWSYAEICAMEFRVILNAACYAKDETSGLYQDLRSSEAGLSYLYNNALPLKVSGIIRPKEDALAAMLTGSIGYTSKLTEYVIGQADGSAAIQAQLADPTTDILTGHPFADSAENLSEAERAARFRAYAASLGEAAKAELYIQIMSLPSEEMTEAAVAETMGQLTRESMVETVVSAYTAQTGMPADTVREYVRAMSDEELTALVRTAVEERYRAQYAAGVAARLSGMTATELSLALDAALPTDTDAACATYYDAVMEFSSSDLASNLQLLGAVDLSKPSAIHLYAASFAEKDVIEEAIADYNAQVGELERIAYTDYVGLMMSSVTTIINAITYVLVAFVGVSLVVSSIMIGVITLISVQERTKEIGILRAIGASKRNVSSMFNAETLIIGFTSGALGVLITYLLCIPINWILHTLTGIGNLHAVLPWGAALILVGISMLLTLVAGIIPSRSAAKKDPVVALRSE